MPHSAAKKQNKAEQQTRDIASNIAEILEFSNQEFKITVINMLRALREKSRQFIRTGNYYKQTEGNALEKNQKEMLKSNVTF